MPDKSNTIERPPVVVVLGHVDHGKSSLLDYIRKTSITEGEKGGITQHVGAYEAVHKDEEGKDRRITFIDTPGHAAFSRMRERGAAVADIAILVVAGDDGVKPQTKEALEAILTAKIPYIVAISKIDKSDANLERTKQGLAEAGVYVEGYGGTVPVALVSSKSGEGVDNLLSLVLLTASLEELTADTSKQGRGIVIESHRDSRAGVQATLILLDGTIEKGECLLIGEDVSPIRLLADWEGKQIKRAIPSSPVRVMGLSSLPVVGELFSIYKNKKDAESNKSKLPNKHTPNVGAGDPENQSEIAPIVVPMVIKSDSAGTLEAVLGEIAKRDAKEIRIKVVASGVGTVSEADVRILLGSTAPIIISFNTGADQRATDLASANAISIQHFEIIYKLTEWLDEYMAKLSPKEVEQELTGQARVIKVFSKTRNKQVLGGVVSEGVIKKGLRVNVRREDGKVGEGKITSLQKQKVEATSAMVDEQFGAIIESNCEVAEGDVLEAVAS